MFGEELSGPEYSGRFIEEVKEMGIGYVTDSMVLSVSGRPRRHVRVPVARIHPHEGRRGGTLHRLP